MVLMSPGKERGVAGLSRWACTNKDAGERLEGTFSDINHPSGVLSQGT